MLNHQHHYGQNFLSPSKNNGKVLSNGELDLFDKSRNYPTELKGTLKISKDPEITGVWAEGDIFELELEKLN